MEKKDIEFILRVFEGNETLKQICIYRKELKKMKENFFSFFRVVKAGGGVVLNKDNQLLVINRYGKWDLPKGHLKFKESSRNGAVREVMEETGIRNPKIIKTLMNTYHTYMQDGRKTLKITHWFEMRYEGNETLVPETQESITEAKWVSVNELNMIMENSYRSLQDVFSLYLPQ